MPHVGWLSASPLRFPKGYFAHAAALADDPVAMLTV